MNPTMTRSPSGITRPPRRQHITDEQLGKQISEMIGDLRDIVDELKGLNANYHVPGSIAPLMQQGLRNAGWAADHLQNALLILQASAMQRGGEGQ